MIELIDSAVINCSISNFYSALRVYLFKNQVINRKLSCVTSVSISRILNPEVIVQEELIKNFKSLESYSKETVSNLLETLNVEHTECEVEDVCYNSGSNDTFLVILKQIPKSTAKFQQIHVLSLISVEESRAIIVPLEDTKGLACNIPVQLVYKDEIFSLLSHPGLCL